MSHLSLVNELKRMGNAEIAAHSQRFFKTGPGEYGEGDRFVGVRVPELRKLARKYRELPLSTVKKCLASPIHEERLVALVILTLRYERGDEASRREIYDVYVACLDRVNNWDLVDASAHKIVGPWLRDRSKRPLDAWSRSKNLWRRRVAVMATYAYIREGTFDDTLRLAERLLDDPEDLIHKAVGWMLREIGKKDEKTLRRFLDRHAARMPRTMLRYAIERLSERTRKKYLAAGG